MSIISNADKRAPKMAEIYSDLAKARAEFSPIEKNRVATIPMKSGGRYTYKYADLSDIFDATTGALAAYGIFPFQHPDGDELITVLAHKSGEQISTKWPIKARPQGNLTDANGFQSAVQVAKRYSLCAALGISPEETIEGDQRAHRIVGNTEKQPDPFDGPDGIRAPHGAKIKPGMSKREIAEESARAIEAQFDEVKTSVGLNGVWNRNDKFIEAMKERHDDLFQSLFDAFHGAMSSYKENEDE